MRLTLPQLLRGDGPTVDVLTHSRDVADVPTDPAPPTYTPGLCWHVAHITHEQVRYGVTPIRSPLGYPTSAALTPCHHESREQ